MKAVLISIQPKWCELIANGEKTVEVRKTKPKIETPFKCYVYCTSSNVHECLMVNEYGAKLTIAMNYKTAIPCGGWIGNGKIIGEFVCDKILFANGTNFVVEEDAEITLQGTCLTKDDIYKYLGIKSGMSRYDKKTEFYRWHISDLVIYDTPKDLSWYGLPRPPQSWCYVEGKEDEGE